MLLWLADELRAAGLEVVEHTDWRTRVVAGPWGPAYGIVHATAAPRTQPDDVQVAIVRNGRQGLPGPIANACVDRAGRWHIIAAGRCNTTMVGTAGPYAGHGNSSALSTEACNDNLTEPWPDAQYDAYVAGWAAWCRRLGWTQAHLVGHKEHTPGRKTDPTFDMDSFRRNVADQLQGGTVTTIDDVLAALDQPQPWQSAGVKAAAAAAGDTGDLSLRKLLEYVLGAVRYGDRAAPVHLVDAAAVATLTDAQLDELAVRVAGRLGALQFVPDTPPAP